MSTKTGLTSKVCLKQNSTKLLLLVKTCIGVKKQFSNNIFVKTVPGGTYH